jgi:hypothetical protein
MSFWKACLRRRSIVGMDELRILVEINGFFTRAEARELGYDDRAVSAAMRAKLWHRIRRGYYTFADTWLQLDEVERHRVRSHAVLRSLGGNVVLSHVSGVLEHGIATWGLDLSRVHVTRLDGAAGRVEGDVVHHEGVCVAADVLDVPAGRVLTPARCVLEAGSRVGGGERALVMTDSLLHLGLGDEENLAATFRRLEHWPWMRRMHVPVRMADGGAESPGESRGRWLFRVHRLPRPETQYKVYDSEHRLVATTDWCWPGEGLFGEFDGAIKYGRILKPGQNVGEVDFAEKQREDLVREITGFGMVRIVWADYDRPKVTARRVERLLRRVG